ncbi:hypothetical protein P466_02446 [Mycobacterium tuberculosis TKK_03_0018]|nr:hypothetical protein P466_02446 [Mycobacterium tuberculosis TKK_03_0018]
MFPSPLGVLGLIREIHCALFKVSVPSRGFGSDDTWGEGMAMMVDEVSVPSRGFGSDDTWGEGMAMMVDEVSVPSRGFGSDDALWSCRGACISLVSVPSRGFGSDDTGRGALTATAHMFPSPLGVLGLTTP